MLNVFINQSHNTHRKSFTLVFSGTSEENVCIKFQWNDSSVRIIDGGNNSIWQLEWSKNQENVM